MATNQYNESPADLETVRAGTVLHRILAANAGYAANSSTHTLDRCTIPTRAVSSPPTPPWADTSTLRQQSPAPLPKASCAIWRFPRHVWHGGFG